MALLERGRVPSDANFQIAYERAVGDKDMPFEVSSGVLDGLLDNLALDDALELAGIERESLDDDGDSREMELTCDELQSLVGALNQMFLDGDEEAGQACETLLGQLGFVWC
jgi:hypothetical protein